MLESRTRIFILHWGDTWVPQRLKLQNGVQSLAPSSQLGVQLGLASFLFRVYSVSLNPVYDDVRLPARTRGGLILPLLSSLASEARGPHPIPMRLLFKHVGSRQFFLLDPYCWSFCFQTSEGCLGTLQEIIQSLSSFCVVCR